MPSNHVEVPSAGKKLRELLYSAFFVADHMTPFNILAGPDFVLGPMPLWPSATSGLIHKSAWRSAQGHPCSRHGHGYHRHTWRPRPSTPCVPFPVA